MRSLHAGIRRFGPLLAAIVGPQALLLAGFLTHMPPSEAHAAVLLPKVQASAETGAPIAAATPAFRARR